MPRALFILFGAAFTVVCCYTLGRILLDRTRARLYLEEQRLMSLVCGAACFHLIIFILMSAQLARRGIFIALGIAILLWGWMRGVYRRSDAPSLPPMPAFCKWLFITVYVPYAFLYLVTAMAPEMSPDGSAYHLGLVSRYLREHGFSRITTNMYANLTQGIEMLYAFAFQFGRHSAAALVHCTFTLAMPLLMIAHARRFGFAAAGVGGAILFLCAPVVGVDGTTAYNDVAVVAVVFTMFSLLHIWASERQSALIIPIGLLAGFCFATKYTTALAIPFAAAFLLWKCRRWKQPWFKPLLIFTACVLVMALPWAAKNWIIVANPLSPFFNQWFPNPNIHISFEQEYIERMRHYGDPKSYWDVPLDLTVRGAMLSGMVGPVFVLSPLALLALRFPEGRRLLLAALIFALPYFNNIGTRFLLPSLPFLSLALAIAVSRSPMVLPSLAIIHALISWPSVLRTYCSPYAWRIDHIPVAAALRITPEEKYLNERAWGYPIARMVEEFVPPGEKVFTFNGIPEAYTTREILVGYQAAFNNNLSEFIWVGLFPDEAPVRLARFDFPEQSIRRLKLVQTRGGPGQWSVSEWRIFHRKQEVPRAPEWRIRAQPNPWDVQMAFDNTPITRWRSWEAMRPGMFIEVDMGSERKIDSVVLETTRDQAQAAVELYGQSGNDGWRLLSSKPVEQETPRPRGLRRLAMDELRARGVRYVLAMSDDPAGRDYRTNTSAWGIQFLAERNGASLYRIEGEAP